MFLGMLPVYLDMKTLLNFYDPQSILVSLACAEMMQHYGIPHCGTSGSGTSEGSTLETVNATGAGGSESVRPSASTMTGPGISSR